MQPNTISPKARNSTITVTPCKLPPNIKSPSPYKFLPDVELPCDLSEKIFNDYLNKEAEFKTEGDRKTMYFGEHGYKYTGGYHEKCEMPEDLRQVIDNINKKYPCYKINSCLVTLYKDGQNHIPEHSDDEKCIDPESSILTVSLGAKRSMTFSSKFGSSMQSVDLPDRSIICSSRQSMEYWKHAILADTSVKLPRISLTLRHNAPYFGNSTLVLGDSNTKYFEFGESTVENPTFGRWMPGRRIKASKIRNLPTVDQIAPYQNIVIHTGINDLLDDPSPAPIQLVRHLEYHCAQIHCISPTTKIIISPILPTKGKQINLKINSLNSLLYELCNKHPNLSLLSYAHHIFADNSGMLKAEMGRYDKTNNRSLDSDIVHLGSKGLRALRWYIKSCIVKTRYNNSIGLHEGRSLNAANTTLHNTG